MSASSVSGVSGRLVDAGLLREVPEAAGPPGFGRPHVPLDLDTEDQIVLAVHFALTHATIAAVDLRGRVLTSVEHVYDQPEPADAVAAVAGEVASLRASYAGRTVLGLGVAIGGWVDPDRGVVVDNPLLGWREVSLRELLATATGLPTYVENHGRAILAAEQLFGDQAVRARTSILHLFVGNLVDASFAIGGSVHQGRRSASGNLAHLPTDADAEWSEPCSCGRTACFPVAASEQTVLRKAAELGIEVRELRDLAALAGAGDERLVALFVERARVVGHAVGYLLDLFNPEVLTLTEGGFLWVPQAREALFEEVAARSVVVDDPREVIAPPSGDNFLAIAAATVLLAEVYADPLDLVGSVTAAS